MSPKKSGQEVAGCGRSDREAWPGVASKCGQFEANIDRKSKINLVAKSF